MLNYKCLKIAIFCIFGCISHYAFSSNTILIPKDDFHWFLGVGGGLANSSLSSHDSVFNGAIVPAPSNQDLYSIKNPHATPTLQLIAGYQWHQQHTAFIPYASLSLQYSHYFNNEIKGDVYQYSLPDFLNYNYDLSYEADNFLFVGKLDLYQFKCLLPYVSFGFGFILNHLNDYTENPTVSVTPRISPAYQGQTVANSAFNIGLGFDYIITDEIWVTVGYEHIIQQGGLKTKNGLSTWSDTQLNLGNIKSDHFFVNLIFGIRPDQLRGMG